MARVLSIKTQGWHAFGKKLDSKRFDMPGHASHLAYNPPGLLWFPFSLLNGILRFYSTLYQNRLSVSEIVVESSITACVMFCLM